VANFATRQVRRQRLTFGLSLVASLGLAPCASSISSSIAAESASIASSSKLRCSGEYDSDLAAN
jgi:hypothetical protein